MLENCGLTAAEKPLNLIDLVPERVVVKQADMWKKKDTSKIKDFQHVEQTSDWTYSTPYKGTVRYLSTAGKYVKDHTNLELAASTQPTSSLRVEPTSDTIPFQMLGP